MSFLKSKGPLGSVKDILTLNPTAGRALAEFHTAVMRQESELSVLERELIAAYVSGLNACQYCHGVHSVTAESFGIEAGVLTGLLKDVDSAAVDEKLKPLLLYIKQLTLEPAKMTQNLADAVFEAGWSEQALHDAVQVCSLFNFMNRLIEGHGVKGNSAQYLERGKALQKHGYDPLLKLLGSE